MIFLLFGCFSYRLGPEERAEWLARNTDSGTDENYYETVEIQAGTFSIGCVEGDDFCYFQEEPSTPVTISQNFIIMKTEVTQELYDHVMGGNLSQFAGDNHPVENVAWEDAIRFANELSVLEGLEKCYLFDGSTINWNDRDCKGWRLPTEAEWEYAAKGGEDYKFSGSETEDDIAWYDLNSEGETHPVGQKAPNGYGLYDMSGNVYEWTWDWYYPSIYQDYQAQGTVTDPTSPDVSDPDGSALRVWRGGSWEHDNMRLRVSYRMGTPPDTASYDLGFRLVRRK